MTLSFLGRNFLTDGRVHHYSGRHTTVAATLTDTILAYEPSGILFNYKILILRLYKDIATKRLEVLSRNTTDHCI